MWIVRFEMVSPIDHPDYYRNEAPLCDVKDVLAQDWKAIAVTHRKHADAVEQFRGLKKLCLRGELIRNVKLRSVLSLADWDDVSDQIVAQMDALINEVDDEETHSGGQDQHGQDEQPDRQRRQPRPQDAQRDQADPTRQ